MNISYDQLRLRYKPSTIKVLFIAESPPPADATKASSRHFYRSDVVRRDDRLFVNTIKALYPEAANQTEAEIEPQKEAWLQRFKADGYYMIEALEQSQVHEVTKQQRRQRITDNLPRILKQVGELATEHTKIILIKSNVFDIAAEPLRAAGYEVLNQKLLDYPGRFNQSAYREKLQKLLKIESPA